MKASMYSSTLAQAGRRAAIGIALLGAAAWLASPTTVTAQSKLNVVTTTEDLAAIAREVGGDRISVEPIRRGRSH